MEKWRPMRGFEGIYWVGSGYHIRNARGHIKKPVRAILKKGRIFLEYRLHLPGQTKIVYMPQATKNQFSPEERQEWVNPIVVLNTETECPLCKSEDIYSKTADNKSYLVCQNCGERFLQIEIKEEE